MKTQLVIAVVGLGYVGLPLAVALSRHYKTVGYDIDSNRIDDLVNGTDRTDTLANGELRPSQINFTTDANVIGGADVVIVCVPTPVTRDKLPDLAPLRRASADVGAHIKRDAIVVYESTVYPGVTEDICVPIIEGHSGMKLGDGFTIGYSPERINPGDSLHSIRHLVKIVSASDPTTLDILSEIYGSVSDAGVHRAPSIRVAEAAKVIENVQRDINIALVNELAIMFHRMNIDTNAVLEAAGTKWNFEKYRPGLVGGHCIPVDPHYLSYAAHQVGYAANLVIAGRKINDSLAQFIAENIFEQLQSHGALSGVEILVLGLAYKANVPDARNSQAMELIRILQSKGLQVYSYDPLIDVSECTHTIQNTFLSEFPSERSVDAVVVTVAHDIFKDLSATPLNNLLQSTRLKLLVDIPGIYRDSVPTAPGVAYWTL